jgi:hypothetical protein
MYMTGRITPPRRNFNFKHGGWVGFACLNGLSEACISGAMGIELLTKDMEKRKFAGLSYRG